MKFGKRFKLTVQVDDAGTSVVIPYPLTLEFRVERTIFASANTGRFTVYNLGESTRNKIFHDRYDVNVYRGVILQAGYADQDPLPIIFQGNVQVAYSNRSHADWQTVINSFDGGVGITSSQTAQSFPAGMETRDILGNLMGDLLHVKKGAIGNFTGTSDRGVAVAGNTWSMISEIAKNNGGFAFIDNEKAHVLKANEYISGIPNPSPIITGQTGLLRAQMQFKNRVDVDIMFDPLRAIGQLVTLQSDEKKNNGDYIIKGIAHGGMISGSVDSETTTRLNLDRGSEIPVGVLL